MGLRIRYHFAYRSQGVNAWARVKRKGSESGGVKRKGRRIIRLTITAFALALSLLGAFFLHSYSTYARIVDARLTRGYLISRGGIYAAPRTRRPGQKFSEVSLAAALRRAGYIESEDGGEIWSASFTLRANRLWWRTSTASGVPG